MWPVSVHFRLKLSASLLTTLSVELKKTKKMKLTVVTCRNRTRFAVANLIPLAETDDPSAPCVSHAAGTRGPPTTKANVFPEREAG